jgi:hypothetical protein
MKLDLAEQWVNNGLRILCCELSPFTTGNYEPALLAISFSMTFEELKDVISFHRKEYKLKQIFQI